jgi:hypothetical protein
MIIVTVWLAWDVRVWEGQQEKTLNIHLVVIWLDRGKLILNEN